MKPAECSRVRMFETPVKAVQFLRLDYIDYFMGDVAVILDFERLCKSSEKIPLAQRMNPFIMS